ncbi:uncharacterized protein LOC114975275 isoform X2 [Acropora millepora]|uniref:uncharacterized protein LOC114975275 isoform X2 n=1 Tax=Acropora millepora TaxID=45264 RepID=UPI001CF53728|nr:uncharacterized protein LOC114975275 isoform X2 [Acropora millepora]
MNETAVSASLCRGKDSAIQIVMITVVMIGSIVGNAIICLLLIRFKTLRTVPNFLVANLAFIDILNAMTNMPLMIMWYICKMPFLKGRFISWFIVSCGLYLRYVHIGTPHRSWRCSCVGVPNEVFDEVWKTLYHTRLPCSFHHYADFGWNNLVYCAQTQQTHHAVQLENKTSQKRRGDRQDNRVDLHGFLLHGCFSDVSTQHRYDSWHMDSFLGIFSYTFEQYDESPNLLTKGTQVSQSLHSLPEGALWKIAASYAQIC